ncbi:MAG: TadE/TadG family protein [Novosphingobium sp.]|nr:TadE/TadG family protein [Novosphingobium sp.]MCP5402640.1 TadE/TadG family protein [Novosphingobium sp.]
MLRRLARDRAGNTFAMVAASVTPLLAMVGGGIDMGRSYLSESSLQQACDAGVLAARKKLGSAAAVDGVIPDSVSLVGNRFFNLNFRNGAYGTEDRSFVMTLNENYSIKGEASVNVPTTIMHIFGNETIPIHVECEGQLNFSNTDVMMVLDTTGSMSRTNPGDPKSKIAVLRDVVKSFHAQLEASKPAGTRIRYGFVPYSTNVNVGFLLKSGWMVDEWHYQGRRAIETGATLPQPVYETTTSYVSGSKADVGPVLMDSCPASTARWTTLSYSVRLDGSEQGQTKISGNSYNCENSDDKYTVTGTQYSDYIYDWTRTMTGTEDQPVYRWKYDSMDFDVSFLKGASDGDPMVGGSMFVRMQGYPSPSPEMMEAHFRGCIEERSTYEIDDYDDVDFSRALDLDIDLTPDPSDPDTQWRPMLHEISFVRKISSDGSGSFWRPPAITEENYLLADWEGFSVCPTQSRKLTEMSASEVSTYVDSLVPSGNTYHDIGMIWGGRLLSPTGIFADENADLEGSPTRRNLIFLTDGETAPRDVSYGTYGIEPLDQRRWSERSSLNLTQTVERRFTVACNEVKKRNITVWVIGFGTSMTDMLKDCAGDGHWFEADDAAQLNNVFSTIAKAMGELRISK